MFKTLEGAANMWKNSLKNVESDNHEILYQALLDFLQRNGTYFLNKPRIYSEVTLRLHVSTVNGHLHASREHFLLLPNGMATVKFISSQNFIIRYFNFYCK